MKRERPEDRKNLVKRTYRFGLPLRGPVDPRVGEQLRLASRYRNRLVEIERRRRDQYHATLAEQDADVAAAAQAVREKEESLAALRAELQEQRTGTRRRQQDPEGRPEVQALAKELSVAYRRLREAEALAGKRSEVKAILDEGEAASRAEAKAASHEFGELGLSWGTRGAWNRVARDQFGKGPPPRFRRWEGGGFLAVQLQSSGHRNGYSIADLLGDGDHAGQARRWVRLDVDPTVRRQGRRYGTLHLRIGSERREPIWASWPIVLHRPIPAEARIKWVRVVARPVAGHLRWSASFELEMLQGWTVEPPGSGAFALDIGWRRVDQDGAVSVQVGSWQDDDAQSGVVRVPPAVIGQEAVASGLRAVRDRLFRDAHEELGALLRRVELPDEHRERIATYSRWRSPRRIVGLCGWWAQNRTDGDDAIYGYLQWYRGRDKHLWEWEANARRKARARRDHHYREIAADLARRYGTLIVEDLDLARLAERPEPESERYEDRSDVAESQRTLAAPGVFRAAVVAAFESRGGRVVRVRSGKGPSVLLEQYARGEIGHPSAVSARKRRKSRGSE